MLLFVAMSACGTLDRGEPSPPSNNETDTDNGPALSFATDIFPVLTADCSKCHGSGGIAASSAFRLASTAKASYDSVAALVSTDNPDQSTLLQRASGKSHVGGVILNTSSPDYELIRNWIAQGAQP